MDPAAADRVTADSMEGVVVAVDVMPANPFAERIQAPPHVWPWGTRALDDPFGDAALGGNPYGRNYL